MANVKITIQSYNWHKRKYKYYQFTEHYTAIAMDT